MEGEFQAGELHMQRPWGANHVGGDWSREQGENMGGEVREAGRVGSRSGMALGE